MSSFRITNKFVILKVDVLDVLLKNVKYTQFPAFVQFVTWSLNMSILTNFQKTQWVQDKKLTIMKIVTQ